MDGRAIREGVELLDLPLDRFCSVLYSYQVDDRVVTTTLQVAEDRSDLYSRGRARAEHEKGRTAGSTPARSIDEQDRETWGTTPEQQAAQRAVMGMAGPPAGPPLGVDRP